MKHKIKQLLIDKAIEAVFEQGDKEIDNSQSVEDVALTFFAVNEIHDSLVALKQQIEVNEGS